MIVYHETNPSDKDSILRDGLKCTSRGEKGDESAIAKTDYFLDNYRPDTLRRAGVSRDNNLYAFVWRNNKIISITDGADIDVKEFVKNSDRLVLRLQVDPRRCFVSDLNAYDTVKKAIENKKDQHEIIELAQIYWDKVAALSSYELSSIGRPEVMVTYDVPASQIKVVN